MLTKRVFWLILLLLAGPAAFVYGSWFHWITIYEEKDREITIDVPNLPGMEGAGTTCPRQRLRRTRRRNRRPLRPAADPEKNPFESPPDRADAEQNPFESPPGVEMTSKKITAKVLEPVVEREGAIVRDVTIGGVVRLADGRLKRTYSGVPPSLCPT